LAVVAYHGITVLYPLLQVAVLIFAGLLLYRYHRPLMAALRRFDRENLARKAAELRDRSDALAHFRHTIARAEEQVEDVTEIRLSDARTGTPVTRFLFEGVQFATRGEAERVRADKVRKLARDFYLELPTALAARREDGKLR
jgi:hypothetical protein